MLDFTNTHFVDEDKLNVYDRDLKDYVASNFVNRKSVGDLETFDVVPKISSTYCLGSESKYWNGAYINNAIVGSSVRPSSNSGGMVGASSYWFGSSYINNCYMKRIYTKSTEQTYVDISGHFRPSATETYDLGSSGYKWNNAYIKYLHCSTFLMSQSGNEYFNINASGSYTEYGVPYSFMIRKLSLFDSNTCVYMQPFDDVGTYNGFSVTLNSKDSSAPNNVYKGRTSISLFTNESLSNPGAYIKFDVGNNSNTTSFQTYIFSHCSYSKCLVFKGTLIPESANTYDIGSDTYSLRWRYVYAKQGYATNGWTTSCDESIKNYIRDTNTLEKLKGIRIKKFKYSKKAIDERMWNKEEDERIKEEFSKGNRPKRREMPEFKDDPNEPDFIMAMAGDFNKAFGVDNENTETINYTNAIGVALRSIQELAEQVDRLEREIKSLKVGKEK